MSEKLTFDEIEDSFPEGNCYFVETTTPHLGYAKNVYANAQWLHEFARNVEKTIRNKQKLELPIAWCNAEGEVISARDKAAYMNHDLAWPMQLEYDMPLYKKVVDNL